MLGSMLFVLTGVGISPSLPGMSDYFNHLPDSEFFVKLTLTIPALIIALTAPFAGILLDRWGRRPVILLSLILYGVAGSSGFWMDSLSGILIGRAFLGLATAGLMSGIITLIGDLYSGEKLHRFMGYQSAALGIGGLIFLVLSGILADIGWRYPFLIHLHAFVVIPGVIFAVKEPNIDVEKFEANPPKVKVLFPWKLTLIINSISFSAMLLIFLFPVHLPFFLTSELGATNSYVGVALALQSTAAIFLGLLYWRIKARLPFQGIMAIIFLCIGINHLIIALFADLTFLAGGMLIGGISLGLLAPNTNVWVSTTTQGSNRGRAVSIMVSVVFLAQFLAPIVSQPILRSVSFTGVFGYGAGISFLLSLILMATHKRKLL